MALRLVRCRSRSAARRPAPAGVLSRSPGAEPGRGTVSPALPSTPDDAAGSHVRSALGGVTRPVKWGSSVATRSVRGSAVAVLLAFAPLPSDRAAGAESRLAAISVSVRPARTRCFADLVEVTGTLGPRQQLDVGVEREGLKVAQILAGPLDIVSAGQALARLVPIEGPDSGAVTLRAPSAGLVLRSQGTLGQAVSPRQGPMFQLVAGGDIDLVAEVPLSDLGRIQVGQRVVVRPLGSPEIVGDVRRIEPGAEAASQVGRLRIGIGPTPDLRVGTFARGVITVGRRCGIGVPYSAVQYEPEGTIVQVVSGDRIETRQVTVGLLSGSDAEIRSGLSESDVVVVRAGPFVREGDQVEPIVVGDAGEPKARR